MILALAGGIGGAKLAKGLADILPPGDLVIVVNTGDDFCHMGLEISPDLDTVMYTLAGLNNRETGWGIEAETWNFMQALERLGGETWFRLGDKDLATSIERTQRLKAGESLSAVSAYLSARLGVQHCIVPMSDQPVRTIVHTSSGPLPFQDYFVRQRAEPEIVELEFRGAKLAKPSQAFEAALESKQLSAIVICPSNPYLSIGPILEIPGVRDRLQSRGAPAVAVSPIVGGRAIKGPAAKIMRELGKEPSALGVAKLYKGLINGLVIDEADSSLAPAIDALGIRAHVANTVMRNAEDQISLARKALAFAREILRAG